MSLSKWGARLTGRKRDQKPEQRPAGPEKSITFLVSQLFHAHLDWLSHLVLRGVHAGKKDEPIPVEHEPKAEDVLPTGPFLTTRHKRRGDLLLFVPRRLESYLIDDLTGGYGYSHLAIDCGEIDLRTGKPVMIESTVGRTVERKFLSEYGKRHFARIPLAKAGVDPQQFCECVKSKLGQPYDNLEALTWGGIDDPAKQVCSDLATICLPEKVRADIARKSRLGMMRRFSVSVHLFPNVQGIREFISPNGFAEYYGAPKGKQLHKADQRIEPDVLSPSVTRFVRRNGFSLAIVLASVLALLIVNYQTARGSDSRLKTIRG